MNTSHSYSLFLLNLLGAVCCMKYRDNLVSSLSDATVSDMPGTWKWAEYKDKLSALKNICTGLQSVMQSQIDALRNHGEIMREKGKQYKRALRDGGAVKSSSNPAVHLTTVCYLWLVFHSRFLLQSTIVQCHWVQTNTESFVILWLTLRLTAANDSTAGSGTFKMWLLTLHLCIQCGRV